MTSTFLCSTRCSRASTCGADIGLDIGRVGRQRAEHQAAQGGRSQFARAMVGHAELVRHPALAVDAATERDRGQVAAQIVTPGVIDALEIFHVAAVVEADQRAAMGTAVFEGNDIAVAGTSHDDRHRAHHRGAVVAGFGDIDLEAQKMPGGAFEHPGLFVARNVGIAVDPVGHAGQSGGQTPVGNSRTC